MYMCVFMAGVKLPTTKMSPNNNECYYHYQQS